MEGDTGEKKTAVTAAAVTAPAAGPIPSSPTSIPSSPANKNPQLVNAVAAADTPPFSNERSRPTTRASDVEETDDDTHKDTLPLSKARSIALVVTVTGASFLNTLSGQSVVIILPSIGRELNVPDTRQQWIVSAYILTFGCFLLLWGRIADIYGKRLIFILGSIWVTIVCAINPFMPNEIAFDVFRGLHGLGAAANVPTAIGILGVTFPPGKAKNYAFSTYAAGSPLGSVFGNLISGLIAEWASWKWVFGATAIMAGMISVAGILFIPPPPPHVAAITNEKSSKAATVDWIGATLITVGLIALMFALTEGNVVGWSTAWIPVLIVISVLVIAIFAVWQWYLETKTNKPPLVKISVFSNWRFSAVMLIMGLFFASFNNYVVYATYFFQEFQGLSPLQTMLRFIPTGAFGIIIAFIVARLLGRVPTLFLLVTGNLCVSVANMLWALPISPSLTYFARGFPAMILAVIGADTAWPCLTLFTSHSLPPQDQAVGGALINAVGMFGRAIGLAIATAVQTAVMADARGVSVENVGPMEVWESATLKGIKAAGWVNCAFGLGALGVVIVTFHSMEIVGKAEPPPMSGGEEGVMNEEDIGVDRRD